VVVVACGAMAFVLIRPYTNMFGFVLLAKLLVGSL
jgi:hypothetical protein